MSPPKGYYGQTALQAASYNGHLTVAKILLAAGADVNAPGGNNGGRTASLWVQISTTHPISIWAELPYKQPPRGGHIELLRWLLDQGADVNTPPAKNRGRTALQAAALGGHADIVEILLHHKADVNTPAVRYHGFTALQGAAFRGHCRIVRRLLDVGADVNAQGSYYNGYTALSAAAECGHYEITRMLLDAGADVSATSGNKKWTAAQIATFRGQKAITEIFQLNKQTNIV
ncbi:ankyrin repeat-containing protein [Penicillium atrosanguineum]|nr:ankyrin repeat-containing protein [Penicillium atrosanguineum]